MFAQVMLVCGQIMKRKIMIIRNNHFPIPPNHYISQVAKAVENVKPNSSPTTVATMGPFFDFGGVLALAISEDGVTVLGIACLIRNCKINKTTGRIEHVSVFPEYQRKGVGHDLVQALLREAKILGLKVVELTTEPARESANILYEKLGFERRHTNVWRYHIKNLVQT